MLKERLKEIIIEILEISEDEFSENADFFYDLGADSMLGLEIVAAVEQEFDIEIEDEEVESLRSYSKLIELIDNKKGVGVC